MPSKKIEGDAEITIHLKPSGAEPTMGDAFVAGWAAGYRAGQQDGRQVVEDAAISASQAEEYANRLYGKLRQLKRWAKMRCETVEISGTAQDVVLLGQLEDHLDALGIDQSDEPTLDASEMVGGKLRQLKQWARRRAGQCSGTTGALLVPLVDLEDHLDALGIDQSDEPTLDAAEVLGRLESIEGHIKEKYGQRALDEIRALIGEIRGLE